MSFDSMLGQFQNTSKTDANAWIKDGVGIRWNLSHHKMHILTKIKNMGVMIIVITKQWLS